MAEPVVNLSLSIPVTIVRSPAGNSLRLELPAELTQWTLVLCLLAVDLVGYVKIAAANGQIVLRCGPRMKAPDRGTIVVDDTKLEITLSKTELETWQHFFLRAFRDGQPEVDHIDVPLKSSSPKTPVIDVAIKLRDARPPMSGADATRMLFG